MTDTAINIAIKAVARREELDALVLEQAFSSILDGEAAAEEIGALLTGLAVRGETSSELIAGARAMRAAGRRHVVDGPLLDTCGTGGLTWTSLNTSTAAAIVIAGAGGHVAKHGNRSVPPKTGSADVLETLGVNIDIDDQTFRNCLDEVGVAFMFAPSHHNAMRHVAPIRKKLGIRTIFNLLGPLTNPAGAQHQIIGVFASEWVRPMAEALRALGTMHALIVHGVDGIDEISVSGDTLVAEIGHGEINEYTLTPGMMGLRPSPLSALTGRSPEHNAEAIRALLGGEEGPFKDIVCANAGAGLYVLREAESIASGVTLANEAIASGRAAQTLERLIAVSNGEAVE
ncbi:MAG: anthranilate phosphoribosyltransferase [Pseudomonadota bacterium]